VDRRVDVVLHQPLAEDDFRNTWTASQGLKRLQEDLAKKIAEVARKGKGFLETPRHPLLQTHHDNLKRADTTKLIQYSQPLLM
jgi:hypothetical protein